MKTKNFKTTLRNLKYTAKHNIRNNKTFLIIFALIGIGVVFFFLFTPYYVVLLFIGCAIVFYGYYYLTTKNEKEEKTKKKSKQSKSKAFVLLLLITSIIYIGSFLSYTYDSRASHSLFKETKTGMIYIEDGYVDSDGRTFAYEDDMRNRQGEIDPKGKTLRLPTSESIVHKLPEREIEDTLTYDIAIVTNFELVDNEITLSVWGGNNEEENDKTEDTLQEVVLTFIKRPENDSEWEHGDFEYYAESIDEIDGYYEDYEYLFFVFEGEIEGLEGIEQEAGYEADLLVDMGKAVGSVTRMAVDTCKMVMNTVTGVMEKVKDAIGSWLHSNVAKKSFYEMMTEMIGGFKVITLIMASILICFIVCFLLMFITGTLKHMKHLLMLLTMAGLLVMMAFMLYSEGFPVIKQLLKVARMIPSAKIQDVCVFIIKVVGYLLAIILWAWTIGSALAICWLLYIVLGKLMDFAGEVLESSTILMKSKGQRGDAGFF